MTGSGGRLNVGAKTSSEEILSETIGAIYECALAHGDLQSVLTKVGDFCGSMSGALVSFDRENYKGFSAHHYGYPEGIFEEYCKDWSYREPAVIRLMNSPDIEIFEESLLIDKETKEFHDYYNWERTYSSHRYRFGARLISGRTEICMTLGRSQSQGNAEVENLKRLKLLMPHLQRSLLLSRRAGDQAGRSMDHLPYGVAIVDSCCRILSVNDAMAMLMRQNDGIVGRKGIFSVCGKEADVVTKAVRQIADGKLFDSDAPSIVIPLPRPSGLRPFLAIVTPAPEPRNSLFARDRRVMVSVSDPERRLRVREEALMQAFGLSPAEARLSQALVEFGDLLGAARETGITPGSARQYMKRIFSKTNTNGQVELVALILGSMRI